MTDTVEPRKLAYGHHRLLPDEHTIVGWGARAIFAEVMEGGQGVVYDRQDAFGPKELFEAVLSPAIDRWFTTARTKLRSWDSGSDEVVTEDLLIEHDGTWYRALIKGSPQKSYGYLYVTALLSDHDAVKTCTACGLPLDSNHDLTD